MTNYVYDKNNISNHALPSWFDDAKLGIFIHWGLFSVPAFAPIEGKDMNEMLSEHGGEYHFAHNPYAEWYLNSLRITGSQTHAYHEKHYGNKAYEDFAKDFNEAMQKWDPSMWADLFKKAGARYAVLVTKHHDGFTLWPSAYPNPRKPGYHASRDVPGELAAAVRKQGLKMGLYYSGKLDWTFTSGPIHDVASMLANGSIEKEYVDYANHHWHELIDKYQPDILWNDIGYPAGTDVNEIFGYYYSKHPGGVINDRFIQIPKSASNLGKHKFISRFVNFVAGFYLKSGKEPRPKIHHDFTTPEYKVYDHIIDKKWECTRGIGLSFGFNQYETEKDYLSLDALVHLFVDIVSKNGNLLLNVGPMADGTIPDIQVQRLLGLGAWLDTNGEAIYGSRPWTRASASTENGMQVRFTKKGTDLFAILLTPSSAAPSVKEIRIESLDIPASSPVQLLGMQSDLAWKKEGTAIVITLDKALPASPAHCFKIPGAA
nr:alpha-L-fucosidase [Candidatus Sigynarchaeota archaeon]